MGLYTQKNNEYTTIDKYGNCKQIELDEEPVIVRRGIILGRYGVEFFADTAKEVVSQVEAWLRIHTRIRGLDAAGKHVGYHSLYFDNQGRRFLHGFHDGNGKFLFDHEGIVGRF